MIQKSVLTQAIDEVLVEHLDGTSQKDREDLRDNLVDRLELEVEIFDDEETEDESDGAATDEEELE